MSTTESELTPPRRFLRLCRRAKSRPKVADSSGAELTGADLLTRTLILRRLLRRDVIADDEQYVGVLLPPTVGGCVVNAALTLDRRIPVNLNYTVSSDVMNQCIERCGIRHVLTSERVMSKLDLELDAEIVYLESFKEKVTLADKLCCAAAARLEPISRMEKRLGLLEIDMDDTMTIIFTSGSTGTPKGVMLTHRNIGSNVSAFNEAVHLTEKDVLVGILPFFHSFGFTVTIWTALMIDPKVVYHYSPLEPRPISKLCGKHRANILIATPTFLRSYIRRCEVEDFANLDLVLTGAEKLPVELADAFEKKFGVRPLEGYGTTELSPVAGVNVPECRVTDKSRIGAKEGTIGRALPGVSAKVVHLDTGEELGPNESGMLLITGPNVMKGYMDQPELTAEVMRDGWYVTGDVAEIDEDGFIKITGRISRFSKIGGEMVPHIRLEEALLEILAQKDADDDSDEDEPVSLVVTAVPHAKKGEQLIVLHTGLAQDPAEICKKLSDMGLPPIWIPSRDSFRQVDEIPVLGTGKLDLRAVKEKALGEFA